MRSTAETPGSAAATSASPLPRSTSGRAGSAKQVQPLSKTAATDRRACACLPLLRLSLQALHRLRRLHALAGPGGTWPRHGSRRGRTILARMPFPVRAIQVYGGSEFMAQFEEACRERGIRLFVLPPARPSSTATSNAPSAPTTRSSTTASPRPPRSPRVNRLLRKWEDICNTY